MKRLLLLSFFLGSLGVVLLAQETPSSSQAFTAKDEKVQGFLPKEDLGILKHLQNHPTHDGRGILVAVIDTGIDLDHPGLQHTSTGERKIVDFYDSTGAGEIPCPVTASVEKGRVQGLSGKWLNLEGVRLQDTEVQLGLISTAKIFPESLVQRLQKEKNQAEERRRIQEEDQQFQEQLQELSAEEKECVELSTKILSAGHHLDILLVSTPEGKRALIDTDGDGDLREEHLLDSFKESGDFVHFGLGYQLNAAVKIKEGGIELYFDAGGHGTHVAGIIGAYYEPQHPLNGLAPGVQFLSIRIGNPLLHNATSHLSLLKAVDYAIRQGAQIINCSFGGPSFENNGAEVSSLALQEILEKFPVLMCISAGNEGPAFGTVGSPATTRNAFAVGALLPSKTQNSNYGVVDVVPTTLFDFSSRGPLRNGELGVDFIAPGAAFSPIPTWHNMKHDNWNGTSMAAPQLSGALAVLLSGLAQEKILWTRPRLRNALERTARSFPQLSLIEQGNGLPQIPAAFQLLLREKALGDCRDYDLEYQQGDQLARGAFFKKEKEEPFFFNFKATPQILPEEKVHFSRQVALKSDVPWLQVADRGMITQQGIQVRVKVLPHLLSEGVHCGRIWANRLDGPALGYEFWFPVTFFAPQHELQAEYSLPCKPGERQALYFQSPAWATHFYAEVQDILHSNSYMFSCRQLSDWKGAGQGNERFWKNLVLKRSESFLAPIQGDELTELVVFPRFRQNHQGLLALKPRFIGFHLGIDSPSEQRSSQNGVLLYCGAKGSGFEGKLQAEFTHTLEDLPLDWTLGRDPQHPELLTQHTFFLQRGTSTFGLEAGESIELVTRHHPVFFDFLDDVHFVLKDPQGRSVTRSFVTRKTLNYTASLTGLYTLEVEVVTLGREILMEKGMFTVELRRPLETPLQGEFFVQPLDGFRKKEASPNLSLEENQKTIRYLKYPSRDPQKHYTGKLKFQENRYGVLAEIPLELPALHPTFSFKPLEETSHSTFLKQWQEAIRFQQSTEIQKALQHSKTLSLPASETLLELQIQSRLPLKNSEKRDPLELESLEKAIQKKIETLSLKDAESLKEKVKWGLWRCRLALQNNKLEEAEKEFFQILPLDLNSPYWAYFHFESAFHRKDYVKALHFLKEIEKQQGFHLTQRLELYTLLEWKNASKLLLSDYLVHYPQDHEPYYQRLQRLEKE